MNNSIFTQEDYEILQRDLLYQGIFRLDRYHLRHKMFEGGWSETFSREILQRRSAVAILPYDPKLNQVVLIEQFRVGAIDTEVSPWLIEIVAGVYDEGESAEEVARRESSEEAGCTLMNLHPIYDYFVSPGGSNEYLHLFIGQVDATSVQGIYGLDQEHENIRAFTLKTEEAFEWVEQGRIKTSPAIISLQWLQLHHNKLRSLWLK